MLKEKQREMTEKEDRKRMNNEHLLNELVVSGCLWVNDSQMNEHLSSISSEGKRKSAVKCQIKVRKGFLGKKHDETSVFSFSKDGRPLCLTYLKSNVSILMDVNSVGPDCRLIEQCLLDPKYLEGKSITVTSG